MPMRLRRRRGSREEDVAGNGKEETRTFRKLLVLAHFDEVYLGTGTVVEY